MTAQEKNARKPYQKPQVERVRLIVEEAILAGCKQSGTTQPGFANCTNGALYCRSIGS